MRRDQRLDCLEVSKLKIHQNSQCHSFSLIAAGYLLATRSAPPPPDRDLSPGGGSIAWHNGHVVRLRISELIIECLHVLQRTLLLSLMMRPEATHTCRCINGLSTYEGHCYSLTLTCSLDPPRSSSRASITGFFPVPFLDMVSRSDLGSAGGFLRKIDMARSAYCSRLSLGMLGSDSSLMKAYRVPGGCAQLLPHHMFVNTG